MGVGMANIRDISDTALWVAVYRARETDRPDAVFRDPFARRMAGERGEQIAAGMTFSNKHTWSFIARTWLFDHFVERQIQQGADMVLNLAAGLDARPYRMNLPASLRWVEVDLPELLAYKSEILAHEKPKCSLERVAMDLSDVKARCELFMKLGRESEKAVIITEGLLIYLTAENVAILGQNLAEPVSFQSWILDLASPALVRMLQAKMGAKLGQAGALQFGPKEGTRFFLPCGWDTIEVRSMLKTAAQLKRLPFMMRLPALFPDAMGKPTSRPWGGVCLMRNCGQ